MLKVLAMGNALTDVLIRVESDDILTELGLPKGSMQLIDQEQFNEIKKVVSGMPYSLVCGGSAANTITGIAKMGLQTGFVFKVHKDEIGENYKRDLDSYGVKTMTLYDDQPSGQSLVFISPDGERTMATFLGAAASMLAEDLKAEMFSGFDMFYVEGYLVQNQALIEEALKMAKSSGMTIALDLASYNVVEGNLDFLKYIMSEYVDIVFANEEEARSFTNMQPEEALKKMSEMTKIAVVKLGANGAIAKKGSESACVGAYSANCLDTTGAGDLFASGFIYGLSENLPLEKCLYYGTVSAGKVIEFIGPRIDNTGWEEVLNLYKK